MLREMLELLSRMSLTHKDIVDQLHDITMALRDLVEAAREAMVAQAITVLPTPGGAISTLVSSSINRRTASACSDLSSVEQMNS